MKAAVLHAFGQPPRYEDFTEPTPGEGKALVSIRAAALKGIDKTMAEGSHYSRAPDLPAVVGIDGVGLLEDGTRVYCGNPSPPHGTMAERTVVPQAFCLPIPDSVDDLTAAALPNAALSGWIALEWRARLQPGETVLILGATGIAGRLAVQIAKHLGAGRIVGVGRDTEALAMLPSLGADATIRLGDADADFAETLVRAARTTGYDVVLDYLWGHPTEVLLETLSHDDLTAQAKRTRLIQIGEAAGSTVRLPASALRSSGLEILGSGGGSVPHRAIFETFPKMWDLASRGRLTVDAEPVPLAHVAEAWERAPGKSRLVFVP